MIREILIWPHPMLKKKASAVSDVDDSIRALVNDMFETMYAADGVGLAAPQLGVLKNVIVLDTTLRQADTKPVAMINPEITDRGGRVWYREGCLSIPGEAEEIERDAEIAVKFLDVDGNLQTIVADELLSVAVQHEMDHLVGTLFVDHISALKRELIRKRMQRRKAADSQPHLAL